MSKKTKKWYRRTHDFAPYTRADGKAVSDEFDAIQASFEKIPAMRDDGLGFTESPIIPDPTEDNHPVPFHLLKAAERSVYAAKESVESLAQQVADNNNTTEQNTRSAIQANQQASQSQQLASQSATQAVEANRQAQQAKTQAQSQAQIATSASSSAQQSAAQASESENLAQKWAANPVDEQVQGGKFSAYHYATQARLSQQTASQAATTATQANNQAQQAKTQAEQSKQSAAQSASLATNAAQTAAEKANNLTALEQSVSNLHSQTSQNASRAETAKETAVSAQRSAQQSAEQAQTAAQQARNIAGGNVDFSNVVNVPSASTNHKGILQLTNDTGLDSETLALTAKAGKALSQRIAQNQQSISGLNSGKVDKVAISDSVSSTSQTNVASSKAAKTAYDKAVEAKELADNARQAANNAQLIAENKQSPATTLAGYGITDFVVKSYIGNLDDLTQTGIYQIDDIESVSGRPVNQKGVVIVYTLGNTCHQEYKAIDKQLSYSRVCLDINNKDWRFWRGSIDTHANAVIYESNAALISDYFSNGNISNSEKSKEANRMSKDLIMLRSLFFLDYKKHTSALYAFFSNTRGNDFNSYLSNNTKVDNIPEKQRDDAYNMLLSDLSFFRDCLSSENAIYAVNTVFGFQTGSSFSPVSVSERVRALRSFFDMIVKYKKQPDIFFTAAPKAEQGSSWFGRFSSLDISMLKQGSDKCISFFFVTMNDEVQSGFIRQKNRTSSDGTYTNISYGTADRYRTPFIGHDKYELVKTFSEMVANNNKLLYGFFLGKPYSVEKLDKAGISIATFFLD